MMFFTTMLVLSCVFSLFSMPYLNTLAMHTTNQLTAHIANKGIPEQLSLHFPRKWRIGEGSTSFKSSMSETCPVILNALPANSKPPAPSCVNSHANSTPVRACATLMCLPKCKAKKHGHCQKILRRLLTAIWQRKAVWKTLFQNKSSGTINPCIYPKQLMSPSKNTAYLNSCRLLPKIFCPATYEEHPMNNNDAIMFCFGKHAMNTWN